MSDIQYETVLAVLYASYVPAQIPSNMILNRISRYGRPLCVLKKFAEPNLSKALVLHSSMHLYLGHDKCSDRSKYSPKLPLQPMTL